MLWPSPRFLRPPRDQTRQPPRHRPPPRWKRWLVPIGVFIVLSGIGGFLVAASGIIPIKASSGHWAVTRWFLNFSKERSVATHTLGTKPPSDLKTDWRVLMGAGHYETGCRPCHGRPGTPMPRIPFAMTPRPPRLAGNLDRFDAGELFYIVKHGIKFTGMPAWPAKHRDDEVWSMVAADLCSPSRTRSGRYRPACLSASSSCPR